VDDILWQKNIENISKRKRAKKPLIGPEQDMTQKTPISAGDRKEIT